MRRCALFLLVLLFLLVACAPAGPDTFASGTNLKSVKIEVMAHADGLIVYRVTPITGATKDYGWLCIASDSGDRSLQCNFSRSYSVPN